MSSVSLLPSHPPRLRLSAETARSKMAIELIVLSGTRQGETHRFEGRSIAVGTDPDCDLYFDPAADPEAKDALAVLQKGQHGWHIHSYGPTKLILNNRRFDGAAMLRSGDVIRLSPLGPDLHFVLTTVPAPGENAEGSEDKTAEAATEIPADATKPEEVATAAQVESSGSPRSLVLAALALLLLASIGWAVWNNQRNETLLTKHSDPSSQSLPAIEPQDLPHIDGSYNDNTPVAPQVSPSDQVALGNTTSETSPGDGSIQGGDAAVKGVNSTGENVPAQNPIPEPPDDNPGYDLSEPAGPAVPGDGLVMICVATPPSRTSQPSDVPLLPIALGSVIRQDKRQWVLTTGRIALEVAKVQLQFYIVPYLGSDLRSAVPFDPQRVYVLDPYARAVDIGRPKLGVGSDLALIALQGSLPEVRSATFTSADNIKWSATQTTQVHTWGLSRWPRRMTLKGNEVRLDSGELSAASQSVALAPSVEISDTWSIAAADALREGTPLLNRDGNLVALCTLPTDNDLWRSSSEQFISRVEAEAIARLDERGRDLFWRHIAAPQP